MATKFKSGSLIGGFGKPDFTTDAGYIYWDFWSGRLWRQEEQNHRKVWVRLSGITIEGLTAGLSAEAGSVGHIIQDEGVDLPQRAKLNFVGARVTASDGATDTTLVEIFGDVDGGFANSTYLVTQSIDGGNA